MSWISKGGKAFRVAAGVAVSAAAVGWFVRDTGDDTNVECAEKRDDAEKKLTFHPQLAKVLASWTTNFQPSVQWDHNWDRRDPKSSVKPSKLLQDRNGNDVDNDVKQVTPSASRHLFLVRHGQYVMEANEDSGRILTSLGQEQADMTGHRLAQFNKSYSHMIHSSMSRAIETAQHISKHLPDVPMSQCDLLREGAPYPPEPPVGHWRPENSQFYQDGARIEAAFRKYFHRAEVDQKTDSHQVLVCHANVIRYFVCRALQIPPEAWLRMSLAHGSITHVIIRPSGRVVLRNLGDSGHLPVEKVTLS